MPFLKLMEGYFVLKRKNIDLKGDKVQGELKGPKVTFVILYKSMGPFHMVI